MSETTTQSIFKNPETRVKINPETYIKFDTTEKVMISNIYSDRAISFPPDILLMLWDMVAWKTVGELIEPWNPDDQEKIMNHLETLYGSKIIVVDESEIRDKVESGLSEKVGTHIHINVENHHYMLRDYVRLAAYRRAIERAVKPGSIVMDLGCGSGILSFFAAQAGAEKVIAVETRPDIIELSRAIAEANGLNQIEYIEGMSSQIPASKIDPKPDVYVSEILGNGILEEHVMEFTIDARDRFLAPGAKMIPSKLDIYVFAFQADLKQDKSMEVKEFQDLYGIDFSILGDVLCSKGVLRLDRYNTFTNTAITEPMMVRSVDFMTVSNPVFNNEFELEMQKDGWVSGYCAYFKAWLDEETILTNSPWAPETHWTQMIYTLPQIKPMKKGDKLPMDIVYDGRLRIRML